MFLCGSSSFSRVDDDDIRTTSNSSDLINSKGSKRATSLRSSSSSTTPKNPFADRGLDKFYSLLAELDEKKQEIYKEMGSEEISFVRFVYNHGSDQVTPIIVKVKDKNKDLLIGKDKQVEIIDKAKNNNIANCVVKASSSNEGGGESIKQEKEETRAELVDEKTGKEQKALMSGRFNGSFRTVVVQQYLRHHPHYLLVVMLVLVMLFLAIFGKSFAVFCTSIGWYLVPSVVGRTSSYSNERKPRKKKKKIRHVQNEGSSSPKSVINGLMD